MNLPMCVNLLIIGIVALAPANELVTESTFNKPEAIIIPLAPFLTRDVSEDDAIRALRYVEAVSIEVDPEGLGVHLTIDIPDPKKGERKHPFLEWTDGSGVLPGKLGLPVVRNAPFIEYVAYVTKAMDWRYEVRPADILITRRPAPIPPTQ